MPDLTPPESWVPGPVTAGRAAADLTFEGGVFVRDPDGDACAVSDIWIERIVDAGDVETDYGKSHPLARPSYFSAGLTPLPDAGDGARYALRPSVDPNGPGDPATWKYLVLGFTVTDGANQTDGAVWVVSPEFDPPGGGALSSVSYVTPFNNSASVRLYTYPSGSPESAALVEEYANPGGVEVKTGLVDYENARCLWATTDGKIYSAPFGGSASLLFTLPTSYGRELAVNGSDVWVIKNNRTLVQITGGSEIGHGAAWEGGQLYHDKLNGLLHFFRLGGGGGLMQHNLTDNTQTALGMIESSGGARYNSIGKDDAAGVFYLTGFDYIKIYSWTQAEGLLHIGSVTDDYISEMLLDPISSELIILKTLGNAMFTLPVSGRNATGPIVNEGQPLGIDFNIVPQLTPTLP